MDNKRDSLDDLIDGALPGYSNAGPVEGLEERVLRRIQLAGATHRSAWPFRLALAVPALAALLLASIVVPAWWNRSPRTSTKSQEGAHLKVSPPESPKVMAQAPGAVKPKARNSSGRKTGAASVVLPKQQFFPSPLPITDEEHALLAWAGRSPLEVRQAVLDLQKRAEEPIAIQTIQIEPLQSDGAQ